MSKDTAIEELQNILTDVLDAHIKENVLPLADVIGVLEIVKLNIFLRNTEDDEED